MVDIKLSYKFIKNIIYYKISHNITPISVKFQITNRCNLRCKYCNFPNRNMREMTTEEILKLIAEFSNQGMVHASFTGGEPLLKDDIDILIDKCRERNVFVQLSSNGTLLDKFIKKVKNVNLLTISLDGPKQAHDMYRGSGSFESALKGIDTAINNNMDVWVTTVLGNHNIDCIDECVELAKQHHYKINFILPGFLETAGDVNNSLPDNFKIRNTLIEILREKRKR